MSKDLRKELYLLRNENSNLRDNVGEQAARIEELEQKLRTTSLEALAISDTNNEIQAHLSEAVKVLERIAANYEDGATFSGTQCADIAKDFLATLGEENVR